MTEIERQRLVAIDHELNGVLCLLTTAAYDFEAAVEICLYAQSSLRADETRSTVRRWGAWMRAASRAATIAAQTFSEIMPQISKIRSQQISDAEGGLWRRELRRRFDEVFPGIRGIRALAAHPEMAALEAERRRHAPAGPFVADALQGLAQGLVYWGTYKGKIHQCPITPDAAAELRELASGFAMSVEKPLLGPSR